MRFGWRRAFDEPFEALEQRPPGYEVDDEMVGDDEKRHEIAVVDEPSRNNPPGRNIDAA